MNKFIMSLYRSKSQKFLVGLFCAVLVASLYTYAALKLIEKGSDFNAHARFAEGLLNGGVLLPHFLYQIFLISIHKTTGMSFINATVILVFFSVFVTFVIAYKSINTDAFVNKYLLGLGIIFLLLSHPIAILAPLDKHLYLGYIAPNVYHNLTLLLLKPIALLHFIFICEAFGDSMSSAKMRNRAIFLALLTSLSVIAKPNYIIVLLPALFGYIMINQFFLKRAIRKQEAILALTVVVPAVLLLTWQYLWFYGGESNNHISIDLFGFYQVYSELWTLVPKLLLSIAFPISVALLLGSQLLRREDFQLSLFMFCISLVYAYVLVESINNGNIGSGNFMWSAQIAYFIFLYVCVKNYLVFLSNSKRSQGVLALTPMVIGACQLFFGLLWYYSNINSKFWLHM